MSAPTFNGQPMTKREILIARSAYDEGYDDGIGDRGVRPNGWRNLAAMRFPLPKRTQARVRVDESGMGWKVEDGAFWYTLTLNPDHLEWKRDDPQEVTHELTAERAALWADLLVNPTEEVEA